MSYFQSTNLYYLFINNPAVPIISNKIYITIADDNPILYEDSDADHDDDDDNVNGQAPLDVIDSQYKLHVSTAGEVVSP